MKILNAAGGQCSGGSPRVSFYVTVDQFLSLDPDNPVRVRCQHQRPAGADAFRGKEAAVLENPPGSQHKTAPGSEGN